MTGLPIADYYKQYIWDKAGMKNTYYGPGECACTQSRRVDGTWPLTHPVVLPDPQLWLRVPSRSRALPRAGMSIYGVRKNVADDPGYASLFAPFGAALRDYLGFVNDPRCAWIGLRLGLGLRCAAQLASLVLPRCLFLWAAQPAPDQGDEQQETREFCVPCCGPSDVRAVRAVRAACA